MWVSSSILAFHTTLHAATVSGAGFGLDPWNQGGTTTVFGEFYYKKKFEVDGYCTRRQKFYVDSVIGWKQPEKDEKMKVEGYDVPEKEKEEDELPSYYDW